MEIEANPAIFPRGATAWSPVSPPDRRLNSDMENEPGKPGTARVNLFGSGKLLGLNIRAFCREGLSSLGKVAHHR